MVSVWLPAAAEFTLLMVRELAAALPIKPTLFPPEQPLQVATLAVPESVLPLASAS